MMLLHLSACSVIMNSHEGRTRKIEMEVDMTYFTETTRQRHQVASIAVESLGRP